MRSGLLVLLLLTLPSCRRDERADWIVVNARIVTMDPDQPAAGAMAVAGGRIAAVGSREDVEARFIGRQVHDLGGRTVLPGIVEAHGHLFSLGDSLLQLNVKGLKPEEVVEAVRERAARTPPGEWIVGWGWDEGAWAGSYPDNQALSRASPDHPVFLRGLHGFAGWANRRALEAAGIDRSTPDPARGNIVRDVSRRPTGILMNQAQQLLTRHIPPPDDRRLEQAVTAAARQCLAHGLTTVHEAGIGERELAVLESMAAGGRLPVRVYAMLDGSDSALVNRHLEQGHVYDGAGFLTVRSIKVFVDGALGSRGAALDQPYSDAPGQRGELRVSEEQLDDLTRRALASGYQVAAHAIGDRANRLVLDVFERILKEEGAADARLRVEHAQVVAPSDLARFGQLGVIASMQPPHATSDMPWAEHRLGPRRIQGAYAWRSVLQGGARLPLSSDFPGESLNPFHGMYAAETRQDAAGHPPGGWRPDQRLTRPEVLRGYTVEAAYAGFEEQYKGKIAPGYLADFIVVSDDVTSISAKELYAVEVLETWLDGERVYAKPKAP